MRAAAAALALLATAAAAQDDALRRDDLGAVRLATCAALWRAQAQSVGDGDGGLQALARRFERVAASRIGREEAAALVAERLPWMSDLIVAYVHVRDDQSRDLYRRLVGDCAAPEEVAGPPTGPSARDSGR